MAITKDEAMILIDKEIEKILDEDLRKLQKHLNLDLLLNIQLIREIKNLKKK